MSLDRFKRTIIKLDKANNRIPQVMLGKEGDYYGRELEVHLLDDGERVDTTGVDLNFQWKNLRSGEFGTLPFEEEDVAKGTYVVAYPPEMLTKGDASCAVQIIEGGTITHTMNFKVSVEGNPLDSEVLMEDNSFKALGEALVKVNSLKQQFDDAVGAITEDSEVILARDGFPTLGERLNSQKEDYANLANDVKELSYITQKYTIDSWQKVQELVRAGLADKAFRIGDQLIADYNGTPYTWDVIGINHDTPTDTSKQYSLTIQAHDCIMNCQFDAPEALYYAEAELPAGTYHFLNNYEADKSYQLALTNAVPAGGIIFISGWETNSPTQIKSFADSTTTNEIETIAIIEGSGGTQLSTINDIRRCRYGSNNYIESNIRQWLNSQDGSFIWDRTTNYSKPSTGAPYAGGGFLSLLDPELVEAIGAVDKQVARNTRTDGGGQDLFSDKVFLLSRKEVFGGDEGAVTGEIPYPWYSALAANPAADPLTGRIKYLSGSARYWWLRSPLTGYSSHPRSVGTTGNVSYSSVNSAYGLAPACCIV